MEVLREKIVDICEIIFRKSYSWLTKDEVGLGSILQTIHMFGMYTLVMLIIVSNIIYPVFWFQCFVFSILFLIWLQHITFRECVITLLERRLIRSDYPVVVDGILHYLNMDITDTNRMGITIILTTVSVIILGLNLISRIVMTLRGIVGLSLWY